MPSSVFSSNIPEGLVEDFIIKYCYLDDNDSYVINRSAYKRCLLEDSLYSFISLLKPHYYDSTQFYLTRKMNYTHFLTIMRQLLRHRKIDYVANVVHTSIRKEVTLIIRHVPIFVD